MVQIVNLGETTQGRLGREMGQAFGQGFSKIGEQIGQQRQASLLSKVLSGQATPEEMGSLSPDLQLQAAGMQQKQQMAEQQLQMKEQERQQKIQEKVAPLKAAQERVQRMRDIGANERLGRGSAAMGFFGGKTARDREEYAQLGKSLISLATTIPIRNRIEFETLAEKLYDPSMPDNAREGVLDAMERIINDSMTQYLGPQGAGQQTQDPEQAQQERPSLESFYKK